MDDRDGLTMTLQDGMEFMAGLGDGFCSSNGLTDTDRCINDLDTIEPEIAKVVDDLIAGNIAGAISDSMQVIKDVPGDIMDCLAMKGSPDLGRLKAWFAAMKLSTIGENAVAHSLKILEDITKV